MDDTLLRIATAISGPVFAAGWVIALIGWLRTPPPKAHPVWLGLLALGYAMVAIPFYMGHGVLIVLAGNVLAGVSAWKISTARRQQRKQ